MNIVKKETEKSSKIELVNFIKRILSFYNATPDEWDELDSILTKE